MNRKIIISLLILLIINFSCSSDEKTDSELLEIDKQELLDNLDSYKVLSYKFCKILIRSSVAQDTVSSEYLSFKSDLDRISSRLLKYDRDSSESFSLLDYMSLYRDYKKMEDFIIKTDEDVFPTLIDAFSILDGDSLSPDVEFLRGEYKEFVQNIEHSILSAIVILSKDLGKEVSLYECAQTKPELLPNIEIKTLLQYFRGFLFFEKGLYYLSEDEITRNIDWLADNKNIDLPFTRAVFQWGDLDNHKTHIAFHSLNHLFRAFDRLMMSREVDEERALLDFEIFINDSKEIGLDNEIIWSIETYLYLKNEESEKAIVSLSKLKDSDLLSQSDKDGIDESIVYLENRESDKVLNGVYDKFFLSKIATKYMLSVLTKIDWEKVLKENDVPHTEEMFETIDDLKSFIKKLDTYTTGDKLKEAGENINNTAVDFWNKAKELSK